MKARILIAGGGTGGHIYPAIATIEALRQRGDFQFLYVGARGGLETRIVPSLGIPLRTLWISGFQRYWTWQNVLFPIKLLASLWASWRILRAFQPHVAVGTGGYVSGPILYLAARRGVPVLIQEQDVYPGWTTRMLAPHARRICLAFEAARAHFAGLEDRIVVTGNPVRQDLLSLDVRAARQYWQVPADHLVLLVFGGSQGAHSLNQALLQIWPRLREKFPVVLIWQTGERDYARVREAIGPDRSRLHLLPYIENMALAYGAADLIVSRAGALTLAELAVVGRPAILVPYPHAAGAHQLKNAMAMEQAGAALVVQEGPEWVSELQENLEQLLADAPRRQRMGEAWKPLARPHAARQIAEEILRLLPQHRPQEAAVLPVDS